MSDSSERDVELASVAAVSDNGVVGLDGGIPWETIPEDTRQYRERVANSPVIVGRVTFDSMRGDLPGSSQVVVSRSTSEFDVETAHRASGVDDALDVLDSLGADRAYVVGGGAVYELSQPVVDRMFLSRVPGAYEGDTYYPDWDPDEWTLVDETEYDEYTLEEWVRS